MRGVVGYFNIGGELNGVLQFAWKKTDSIPRENRSSGVQVNSSQSKGGNGRKERGSAYHWGLGKKGKRKKRVRKSPL